MAEIGIDINRAKKLLTSGELVAIPTETVYGLAGNALDPVAVTKIFKTKNRPQFDPLIIHVASIEKSKEFVADIPAKAILLANHFWPGPLTLVLKKKEIIPDIVTSGLGTVGVRCPDHSLTRSLLEQLPFPLAAPSANPFGYVSPTNPDHVNDQLGDRINYILDGGQCEVGIESTIVGFENDRAIIYRRGGLSQEKIESVIGNVETRTHTTSNPVAPGQLESHYAPNKQLILGDLNTLLKQYDRSSIGVLSYTKSVEGVDDNRQIRLTTSGNLEEAAQHLFAALRQFDKMDIKFILAEEVPDHGLGKAINDRLRRASAKS